MFYLKQLLPYAQIVISVLLVASILMQQKGAGLGGAFGGSGGEGNVYRSKRGLEKLLFRTTIGLASLFFLTAFLGLLV